ncbi:hypothetical protein PC121_g18512 [Phytophthora cactorum]|nr:hypothetical protein PC121_g18512 [Phytophthora cactorum]
MFLFLKAALQCAFNRVGIRRASAPCTPMASHNHWGGHVDVLRLAPWPNTGFHCPTGTTISGIQGPVLRTYITNRRVLLETGFELMSQRELLNGRRVQSIRSSRTRVERGYASSTDHPLAYLDEAQSAFKRAHQVLNRSATHIKEQDISRFAEKLCYVD